MRFGGKALKGSGSVILPGLGNVARDAVCGEGMSYVCIVGLLFVELRVGNYAVIEVDVLR